MPPEVTPVDDGQQQSRAGERGEKCDDTNIPDMMRSDAHDARSSLREKQCQQHTDGSEGPVAWYQQGPELEKDWMHCR